MITDEFIEEIRKNVVASMSDGQSVDMTATEICRLIDAKIEQAMERLADIFQQGLK